MIDWHDRMFASATELRKKAAREDRLADAAEEDGDTGHALFHRNNAAQYREAAREKEIS